MKKLSNGYSFRFEVFAAIAIWLFAIVPAFSMSENTQGTEFWPPIFGYQFKVTDTLVALFTFGLFVATALLWRATKKLVDGAQETAERQLRAYVSVKEIVMDQLRHRPQYGLQGEVQQGAIHNYRISVMVENTGQTPTRHARVNINWQPKSANYSYGDGSNMMIVCDHFKTKFGAMVFGSPGFFVSIADVGNVADVLLLCFSIAAFRCFPHPPFPEGGQLEESTLQHRIASLPVSWARRSPRRMSRRAGELSDVFPQPVLGQSGRRKSRKNFAQSSGGASPVSFWSGNLIAHFHRWREGTK